MPNESKKGSQLPTNSSPAKKVWLIGFSEENSGSVKYPLASLIKNIEDGDIIPALAEDLNIPSVAVLVHTQSPWIQPTGGSDNIRSGSARVLSFKGTNAGIQASGAKIIATGFNQLLPSGISGQTATFPVVASIWGAYGSAEQNNGYLFVNNNNEIVVPTAVKQDGVDVPTHTNASIVYYLPANNGQVTVTFASGVNVAQVCAHICWSNYRDNEYAVYNASQIDISSVITSIGGTMRRVEMGPRHTYDEIVMSDTSSLRKWYRRVGQLNLPDLNWSVETITEDETTRYKFTAPVTGIASDGIYQIIGSAVTGFKLNGTSLILETSSYSTVAALKTAMAGMAIKFELATVTSGNHSLTGALTVDDFGTIRVEAGSATVIDMDIEFHTNWKDIFKNIPDIMDVDEKIAAASLCDLNNRLNVVEKAIQEGFANLIVENLTIKNSLQGSDGLIDRQNRPDALVLRRTGVPSINPVFVGQIWIDTTTGAVHAYLGTGTTAVTDWLQIA